jgi:hypothetical protein
MDTIRVWRIPDPKQFNFQADVWNAKPFKDENGNVIGTTRNARVEGGFVVVDIAVLGQPETWRDRPGLL